MDVEQLTDSDRLMWEKIKNYPNLGTISREEFNAYRDEVLRNNNPHRNLFSAFLANQLGSKWSQM